MVNMFNPDGKQKTEREMIVQEVISELESSGKLKASPPKHQVSNNAIRFENPDGTFGPWLQLPTSGIDPKFGSGYFPGGGGAGAGGSGKPADPDKSIQFNDNGVFGG